jgi:hypothetical protein
LSEKASIIGNPAAVFTENKDPDNESSIWNNLPDTPSTVNTLDPEAFINTEPVNLWTSAVLSPNMLLPLL